MHRFVSQSFWNLLTATRYQHKLLDPRNTDQNQSICDHHKSPLLSTRPESRDFYKCFLQQYMVPLITAGDGSCLLTHCETREDNWWVITCLPVGLGVSARMWAGGLVLPLHCAVSCWSDALRYMPSLVKIWNAAKMTHSSGWMFS